MSTPRSDPPLKSPSEHIHQNKIPSDSSSSLSTPCQNFTKIHHHSCPICSLLMNPLPASRNGADYIPTPLEEGINVLTHIFPIFFFSYYSFQIWNDDIVNNFFEKFAVITYGMGMNVLFGVSSLYHFMCLWLGRNDSMSQLFRIFDHATIYLFIACSYTPWLALVDFGRGIGHVLTGVVWTFCFAGLVKMFFSHKFMKFLQNVNNVTMTNVMGWIGCLMVPSALMTHVPVEAFMLLILGGCFFSFGCIFLVFGNGRIPFSHGIWHVFVFLGVLSHFTALYAYLLNLDSIYHPDSSHHSKQIVLDQILDLIAGKKDWNYPKYFVPELVEWYYMLTGGRSVSKI
ncbi:hypothetical protein C9374_011694 [Naegleria lovaniensis]|uniref:Uncharacterized protein n=1 Tax=Naegleria lovaniensis TaxID=51637 RepID=A0AA88GEA8_NAELO|nr:uncharacterized protein C9374_011694 [Naegleria lovaniensis]KAG2373809.1 hypothetical protein C9374_011694 [Naegleria lovaniensis]